MVFLMYLLKYVDRTFLICHVNSFSSISFSKFVFMKFQSVPPPFLLSKYDVSNAALVTAFGVDLAETGPFKLGGFILRVGG